MCKSRRQSIFKKTAAIKVSRICAWRYTSSLLDVEVANHGRREGAYLVIEDALGHRSQGLDGFMSVAKPPPWDGGGDIDTRDAWLGYSTLVNKYC